MPSKKKKEKAVSSPTAAPPATPPPAPITPTKPLKRGKNKWQMGKDDADEPKKKKPKTPILVRKSISPKKGSPKIAPDGTRGFLTPSGTKSWNDPSNIGNLSIREKLALTIIIIFTVVLCWVLAFCLSLCGSTSLGSHGYEEDLTICKTTWSMLSPIMPVDTQSGLLEQQLESLKDRMAHIDQVNRLQRSNLEKEQYLVKSLREQLAAAQTESETTIAQLNELKEASQDSEATVKTLDAKCKEQTTELMEQVQVCETSLQEQLAVASAEAATVLAELNQLKEVKHQGETSTKTLSNADNCEKQTSELKQQVQFCETKRKSTDEEAQALAKRLGSITLERDGAQGTLRNLQNQYDELLVKQESSSACSDGSGAEDTATATSPDDETPTIGADEDIASITDDSTAVTDDETVTDDESVNKLGATKPPGKEKKQNFIARFFGKKRKKKKNMT